MGEKYTTGLGKERSVRNVFGTDRDVGADTKACKEVKEGFGKRLYEEDED